MKRDSMSTFLKNNGVIKADIGELLEQFDNVSQEVMDQVAHLIVGYAKVFVPVDTGSLRDSIRVERGGAGKGWREFRVRAGGYITNPETGKLVNYAGFVEFGTRKMPAQPYLSLALIEAVPELLLLLQTELQSIEGVDSVSINGEEVTVKIGVETEAIDNTTLSLNKAEAAGLRTARIIRKLTGSEALDQASMSAQKIISVLNSVEYAARAATLATLTSPLGIFMTSLAVASVAYTIGSATDGMMSLGE